MTSTHLTTIHRYPPVGGGADPKAAIFARSFRPDSNNDEAIIDGVTLAPHISSIVQRRDFGTTVHYSAIGSTMLRISTGRAGQRSQRLLPERVAFELPAGFGRSITLVPAERKRVLGPSRARRQSTPPWQLRHLKSEVAARTATAISQPLTGHGRTERMTLYVASMVDERDLTIIHAFAASMATSETEFRRRLAGRAGWKTASTATVTSGFDPSEPIAAYLLPDSIAEILADVRDDPRSILADGLDVFVEHRFAMERFVSAPLCRYD